MGLSSHSPTAHEVETFSGSFVDVSNPSAATITLEDIAHALSNTCRYGGHCSKFYSVAEHAVFVSRRLERRGHSGRLQLAGLHHDDSEAFLGDIPRPMKPLLGQAYTDMTDSMDQAIIDALALFNAFSVSIEDFHSEFVKAADNWALFVEARHLLPSRGRSWDSHEDGRTWSEGLPSRIVIPDYWYDGLSPKRARALFLARHKELTS